MDCPVCSGPTKVIDSRPRPNNSIRRRRECENCGYRFSTTERKVAELVAERLKPVVRAEVRAAWRSTGAKS